jgi:DNA oxidative demethylase
VQAALTANLFETVPDVRPSREAMADGAVLLRGFVRPFESDLIAALREIVGQAPFRRMFTPGGHQMSVAMTNCGSAGWVTDHSGYRYDGIDSSSGRPWPAMPAVFCQLAEQAAAEGGFEGFAPDACLINRYTPGARMSLHQDKGYRLEHGDVVVWGGPSRLFFHGVAPLADGEHALMGRQRINLTFRKAR